MHPISFFMEIMDPISAYAQLSNVHAMLGMSMESTYSVKDEATFIVKCACDC